MQIGMVGTGPDGCCGQSAVGDAVLFGNYIELRKK